MSDSWKKYGGTTNYENTNNITVNSLVANNLTLRNPYLGTFEISGNLIVDKYTNIRKDLLVGGNIYAANNIDVSQNVYVYGNVYITGNTIHKNNVTMYQKLYFGPDQTNYFYGNSSGIGINTSEPQAALDICSNSVASLNVFTNKPINRNIIARNNTKKGIMVLADSSNSTIQFFSDVSINTNTYDAQIQNTTGGYLNFDVSNSVQFFSRVGVSDRSNKIDRVNNETVVIQDTSSGFYLPNMYDNSCVNTGNALSLVGYDNSSNTFLNMMTPSGQGLSIVGGAYPPDLTRSMGAIGITDISRNFVPVQTMIPQKKGYFPALTGINTYSPNQNGYVMDVNGPIHLGNGTILNSQNPLMEIKQIKTPFLMNTKYVNSTTPYSIGFAIGSPTAISDTSYNQQILYSPDGGITWTPSQIDGSNSDLSGQIFTTGYVYDQSFAMIAGTNGTSYVTNTGGQKWNKMTTGLTSDFTSLHMIDVFQSRTYTQPSKKPGYWTFGEPPKYVQTGSSTPDYTVQSRKRVFMSFVSICIMFDVSNSDFDASFSVPNDNMRIINNTLPITTMAGYGGYLYLAGTNINKYDVSLNGLGRLVSTHNSPGLFNQYNSVYAYDNNHVIAVGTNGIISYTHNGGSSWNDISIPGNTLNGAYIVDSSNAVIVGNNGFLQYSTDGYFTWQTIPTALLNSNGNARQITSSSRNLTSVTMPDINTVLISSVEQAYSTNSLSATKPKSRIFTCYLPNLFNKANNGVFDVCGNMVVSGDIRVNDSGKIMSNNSTFSLLNEAAVTTIDFGKSATTMNIGSAVSGTTTIKYNAVVSKNLDVSNNTLIRGNVTVNGNNSVFTSTVDSSKTLTESGPVENPGSVQILGGASINGNLFVNKTVYSNNYESALFPITSSLAPPYQQHVINIGLDNANGSINIGSINKGTQSQTINIGGPFDTVNIAGTQNNVTINNTELPRIIVNGANGSNNNSLVPSSAGAGISIKDYSNNDAGYMVISEDKSGFVFKATSIPFSGNDPNPNHSVKLDTLMSVQVGSNQLMVLQRYDPRFYTPSDNIGSYDTVITSVPFDLSSVFQRNADRSAEKTAENGFDSQVASGRVYIDDLWSLGGNFANVSVQDGRLNVQNSPVEILNSNVTITNGSLLLLDQSSLGGDPTGDITTGGGIFVTKSSTFGQSLQINGLTDSTVVGTGSFIVGGGASIGKTINVGGDGKITGILTINNTTNSTGLNTGSLINKGGMYVAKDTFVGGNFSVAGTTQFGTMSTNILSSSTSFSAFNVDISGSVTITGNNTVLKSLSASGDVTIGGNVNITNSKIMSTNGPVLITNVTDTTNSSTGALIVSGGISIGKNTYIGGNVVINSGSRLFTNTIDSTTNVLSIGGLNQTGNVNIGSGSNTTVRIGNSEYNTPAISSNIYIGGPNDTVTILGNIILGQVSETSLIKDKTTTLNYSNTGTNTSAGSGIQIYDNSLNNAGYMVVSNNRNGYLFKSPNNSNVVNLNVSGLTLTDPSKNGLLVLQKTTSQTDSNYTIGSGTVGISSIDNLQNTLNNRVVGSSTFGQSGSQTITSALYINDASGTVSTSTTTGALRVSGGVGITGNVYVGGKLVVNSPVIFNRLGLATTTTNPTSSLDVSGQITQNGYIWQF